MAKRQRVPAATGFEGVSPSVVAAWQDGAQSVSRPLRDPGPEYLSAEQLESVWGVSRCQVSTRLRKLRRADRLAVALRDELRANGSPYPVPVYRLKGDAK